jgi:hypothetical protein
MIGFFPKKRNKQMERIVGSRIVGSHGGTIPIGSVSIISITHLPRNN